MDLEDVSHKSYNRGTPECVHSSTNFMRRREGVAADQDLGAELEVSLGGDIYPGSRDLQRRAGLFPCSRR
jgi:hypothetical protein